ncbi:MAG: pyridoxamine 5'-phosphate oxidase family protein [bacterium]
MEVFTNDQRRDLWFYSKTQTGRARNSFIIGQAGSGSCRLCGYSQAGTYFRHAPETRKCKNLRLNPNIAFVIGWDEEITLQYEGKAEEPKGSELERY